MIGVDILKIDRIEKLKKHDDFYERIFTEREIEYINSKNGANQTIAGLYCAKEAISKLLGTGLGSKIWFKDMEILHEDNKPYLNVHNKKLKILMDFKGIEDIYISITHEKEYAICVAHGSESDDTPEKNINYDMDIARLLPKRDPSFNKYDYGKIMLIGGKRGMAGSISLAAKAAMKSGAGLTYVYAPDSIETALSIKLTEPIIYAKESNQQGEFGNIDKDELLDLFKNLNAIGVGTGMGKGDGAREILEFIIENYKGPLVIDADAINILAEHKDLINKKHNIYITAHEMEFSRISGINIDDIKANRISSAKLFSEKNDVNLLLKGKNSIIINKDKEYINFTGNSGMATAGSGDVLTGITTALLAREDSIDMLYLAAYIHGLAGDLAKKYVGEDAMIASDIIKNLPFALKEMRKGIELYEK